MEELRNKFIATLETLKESLEIDRIELLKYMIFFNTYLPDEHLKNPYLKQFKDKVFEYANEFAKTYNYHADVIDNIENYINTHEWFEWDYVKITDIISKIMHDSEGSRMQVDGILGKLMQITLESKLNPRILTVNLDPIHLIREDEFNTWLNEFEGNKKGKTL